MDGLVPGKSECHFGINKTLGNRAVGNVSCMGHLCTRDAPIIAIRITIKQKSFAGLREPMAAALPGRSGVTMVLARR